MFIFSAEFVKFCYKIYKYFSLVNILSINCKLPATEKQHTRTAPHPCFTVEVIKEGLKLSPTFFSLLLFKRSWNVDLSVNITFFQKSIGLITNCLANANCLWALRLLRNGRFLDTLLPWYPASFIFIRICVSLIGRFNSDFNCFEEM